jgi:DNA-binding response OmpR family regulator
MQILFLKGTVASDKSLISGLKAAGHVVDIAGTYVAALLEKAVFEYDLIILDQHSLGVSAIDAIRQIRFDSAQIAIFVLATPQPLEIKLLYFELGADDFMVKPVPVAELVARVKAVFRRLSASQPSTLTLSSLKLDRFSRRVFWHDEEVQLTKKEFLLLEYLMLHPDKIISRKVVMENVWQPGFDEDGNIVDVYIDQRYHQKLIYTVRGDGYTIRDDKAVSIGFSTAAAV